MLFVDLFPGYCGFWPCTYYYVRCFAWSTNIVLNTQGQWSDGIIELVNDL